MTPNEIIRAYRAVHELTGAVLPYKLARDIARLKKRLSEEFEVVLACETSLAESYGGRSKNGQYDFPTRGAADSFARDYKTFLEQEDRTIDLPKVDLSKCADMIRISPDAIDALDGIVFFEEV